MYHVSCIPSERACHFVALLSFRAMLIWTLLGSYGCRQAYQTPSDAAQTYACNPLDSKGSPFM
jgi:hypothetical protein